MPSKQEFEYEVRRVESKHIERELNRMAREGWRFVEFAPGSSFDIKCVFERAIEHPTYALPNSISFTETTMNPTAAGQSQVFTGTLAPAGATYPADTTFTITSNDPAISPSVDSTGLIVSVSYPAGWTESTTTPLAFSYAAASASNPTMAVTATITPSAPVTLPTSITFAQTT